MTTRLTYLIRLFRLAKQGGIKVVCLLLCLTTMLSAQDMSNPHLIPFGDKLPGSYVNCMLRDSLGFLWLGTNEGLVRYDGTRIKIYSQDSDNPQSLGGSNVYHMMLDGHYMWCAHNRGITRYDLWTETFRSYEFEVKNPNIRRDANQLQDVTFVIKLRNGDIWAGLRHDGMVRYDAALDSFIRVRPPSEMVRPRNDANWSADHMRSVVEDKDEDGILWLGTLAGLLKLDTHTEEFELFHWEQEDKEWETNLNVFRRMVQLPDGRLCWGTWHAGVHVADPDNNTYSRLPNTEGDGGNTTTSTSRLTVVGDTMLWISTGLGVCGYDLREEKISKLWLNDYAQGREYSFDYIDSDNRVYGNVADGINVYDPMLQQFKGYSIASIDPSRRGMVFDAYYDPPTNKYLVSVRSEGAYTMIPGINKWEKVPLPEGVEDRLIGNIRPTHEGGGTFFIQVDEDILVYDIRKGKFTGERYHVDIPTGSVKDMIEDASGTIWLSTNRDGYYHLKRHNGGLTRFITPGVKTVAAGERGVFCLDSKGRMWMKKRNSLHVYDPSSNRLYDFMEKGYSFPFIQTFAEHDGFMYFVSSGRLLRMAIDDIDNAVPDTVKIDHGFPSVVRSPDGILWGANNANLYRYDPETGKSDIFNFEYGSAPAQIFDYSFTEDGRILLGDFEQLIIVDPRDLSENESQPVPYVTSLRFGGREVHPNLYRSQNECIKLAHDEDFFSLDISSISYVLSDQNTFKYRLRDLQEDWTDVSGAQTINFTNVPSGEYTFELMAANNEGIWNEQPYFLPIMVGTAWYNTPLARISALALLFFLGFLAYQYRVGQIRKEERMRTQYERQLADVEMSALRAQMNPHFIFNCLNSIENFIIKNDTLRASTYLHDFARLIRLILQNSRAKSIPLKDELEALELYLEMESLRFTNKFEYDIVVEPDVAVGQLEVPPMIIQPYVENAIWHGLIPKQEPGRLVVHLSRRNGTLNCAIEDDGIGRAKSAEINSRRKHDKPKSMGMSITSERIEILNRLYNTNTTINIVDKRDASGRPSGTRVELNMPVA